MKGIVGLLLFSLTVNKVSCIPGKLLLLMIDGLKHDYMTNDLPGFKALRERGVVADYVKPEFPSVTLTNWMSVLTGRYKNNKLFFLNLGCINKL